MSRLKLRLPAAWCLPVVLVLSMAVSPPWARAQEKAVDPAAVQILKEMTEYLGRLPQFSVHTQNSLEDVLDSGHMVIVDVSASMVLSRPNRLRAERRGEVIDQVFYYDGKTLTLYNPTDGVYATEPAPATIEEMLDFARESLGLIVPAADLVYRDAFTLLMQDVTFAAVLGKAVIDGVTCNHLLFSRPGVDFQVWVADNGQPLPCKYVVTDTQTPGHLSITTVMSDWDTGPAVADARFSFVPPQGTRQIAFMPLETGSGSDR